MSKITLVQSEAELASLFTRSHDEPIVIFKHSLTCPISTAAYRRFETFLASHPDIGHGLIEIQNHRSLSNAVSERSNVRHESPQALVLEGGEVRWHASHGAIDVRALEAATQGT